MLSTPIDIDIATTCHEKSRHVTALHDSVDVAFCHEMVSPRQEQSPPVAAALLTEQHDRQNPHELHKQGRHFNFFLGGNFLYFSMPPHYWKNWKKNSTLHVLIWH